MSDNFTRIVVSEQHFLYLPLYYAEDNDFFGYLPKGHKIEITISKHFTDTSAFDMMLDVNTAEYRDIDFAVCDPACALSARNSRAQVVVLAEILTNSAFWAVNHKSGYGSDLKHLALFDKIISYGKGTTSFAIANRIFDDPNKSKNIITVDPRQELHMLRSSGRGTLALSPDILLIQHLLETQGHTFDIELSLAQTPEYHGMLVTALMTRQDVLRSKPDVVTGLLKALQHALIAVRASSDDVIHFAASRFGEKEHTVRRALEEAHKADVYSTSLKISEATWKKLAERVCQSENNDCSDAFMKYAMHVYKASVEFHTDWAVSAMKAIDEMVLQKSRNSKYSKISIAAASNAVPAMFLFACFLAHALLSPTPFPWYGHLVFSMLVGTQIYLAKATNTNFFTLDGVLLWLQGAPLIFAVVGAIDTNAAAFLILKLTGWDLKDSLSPLSLLLPAAPLVFSELQWWQSHREKRTLNNLKA